MKSTCAHIAGVVDVLCALTRSVNRILTADLLVKGRLNPINNHKCIILKQHEHNLGSFGRLKKGQISMEQRGGIPKQVEM